MIPRMLHPSLKAAAIGVTMMVGSACMDLTVTNPNEPDRERALNDELAVQSLVAGSFQTWWDIQQGRTTRFLSAAGQTHASSALNYGTWDAGHEPSQPVVNQLGYQWGYPIEDPFMIVNRANAAIRDGILMIEGGLQIGDSGAGTPRLLAFAKFMLGLNHGFIAQLYDQGWIIDETVDTDARVADQDLRPYQEVMEAALDYFAQVRQLASQNEFTIPAEWMGATYSREDLVRLTHSYEARFLSTVARNEADRAAVDWTAVLSHIEQGVTEDFGIEQDGPGGIWNSALKGTSTQGGGIALRLLGPADQSGAFQHWLSQAPRDRLWFLVETDDRRIHAAGDKEASGTLIQIRKNASGGVIVNNDADRGLWYQTPYSSFAWRAFTETSFGFTPELTVEEMDFLRAEAYIRLGRAPEALPIINKTRVENGNLPPATLAGVSGERCVPRKLDGSCGDLMDALIYEKRLETLWLSGGLEYYDGRGFGILVPGTFIHLPVPALELQSIDLPVYTFGAEAGGGTS